MKPAQKRALAGIQAELSRVVRYDDESIVNDTWIRQRYDCGCFPSLGPARQATVKTAWHEAGHAGAALAVGLPRTALSSREVEVLKLVAVGQRNKEVAFQLNIAEATVNAHVKHILEKLDASDRTEAVTIALRRGIIRL